MNSRIKKAESALLEDLKGLTPDLLTIDDFLGGRVRLFQLKKGYRAGMDAVLLAASIPLKEDEKALDIGSATGGVALCLAERAKGGIIHGLEIQEGLCAIGRGNIRLNSQNQRVRLFQGTVLGAPAETPENYYDHVFANPPYLEGGQGICSPSKSKKVAHFGDPEGALEAWVKFALSRVKNKGTITFIFRADRVDELISAFHRRAGEMVIFPLWPHKGQPANRVIVQARKGLHGGATLLSGLVLHGKEARYSKAAEKILRDGQAIDLACFHRAKGPA